MVARFGAGWSWPSTVAVTLTDHFLCETCIPELINCPEEDYYNGVQVYRTSGALNGTHILTHDSTPSTYNAVYKATIMNVRRRTYAGVTPCTTVFDSYASDFTMVLGVYCVYPNNGIIADLSYAVSGFPQVGLNLMTFFGLKEGELLADSSYDADDLVCAALACPSAVGYPPDQTIWRGGTIKWLF